MKSSVHFLCILLNGYQGNFQPLTGVPSESLIINLYPNLTRQQNNGLELGSCKYIRINGRCADNFYKGNLLVSIKTSSFICCLSSSLS